MGAVDRVGYQQRVSTRLCWGGVATTTRRLPTSAMCKIPRTTTTCIHPRSTRTAFVTPRSLEAASDWMKVRDKFNDKTLTSLLIGTIGGSAAGDMMAFARLADQLPSIDSIKSDPQRCASADQCGCCDDGCV